MKIGVLALQGAFREHRIMLEHCGADVVEVRSPEHLDDLAGLVIPGGESTTIGKMMVRWGLLEKICERHAAGMGIYGTCAGMILLAKAATARFDGYHGAAKCLRPAEGKFRGGSSGSRIRICATESCIYKGAVH